MRKSSRGGWAIFIASERSVCSNRPMQPFLGWVLELDACFAERGFWLRCLARLYAAAPVNPLCSDAVPRGRAFTEAGLGLRAPGSGRRGKQPSDRSGRCLRALVRLGFWHFVFRARGERSSPHPRRPGTAGREGALWGLGMMARRRRWKGCRSVGCPCVGPRRARGGRDASFWSWYLWMGRFCWLDRNFWVSGGFCGAFARAPLAAASR
jgi:hypothetical protein